MFSVKGALRCSRCNKYIIDIFDYDSKYKSYKDCTQRIKKAKKKANEFIKWLRKEV